MTSFCLPSSLVLLVVLVSSGRGATEPPTTTAATAVAAPSTSSTTSLATTTSTREADHYPPEPWFPLRGLILDCFPTLSWPCTQRKLLVYIDQLNRARQVTILGDVLMLVKVRQDHTPPITEDLLTARQIQDKDSLWSLMELVADRFMDSHVLRLMVPSWEEGRLVDTPLDVTFVEPTDATAIEEREDSLREGRDEKGGKKKKKGGKMKKKGGKKMMKMMAMMGKKAVEMMGKVMMTKFMMMVPIAMKKAMIGGFAGMMSMGMMKFMLLQKVIGLLKMKIASCGGGGGGGGGFMDMGGGGECGGYGGGGGGGYDRVYQAANWDRNYNTNNNNYNYAYSNYPYSYYAQQQQQQPQQQQQQESSWSLWKK